MATRSATFAGWFTCGSGLKMPEPIWMRSVVCREVASDDVVGREVRVLVEEVVLGDPDVLEARLVGRLDRRDVIAIASYSAVRIPGHGGTLGCIPG